MTTIALVDDDENIVASLKPFFEAEGYTVRAYHDGESALQGLAENPPDLAILDVKMPKMDGMELLRRLRQTSDLPAIFLTSKDDEIDEVVGFNIGAAGQPPHCRNSLHNHTTAEVFFVLKGRWRFFWGRYGTAGEFVAEEGDIFNIPTGIFRGFENVGTDYGMIMAILGGDDAGGGVTWAPQVIEEARAQRPGEARARITVELQPQPSAGSAEDRARLVQSIQHFRGVKVGAAQRQDAYGQPVASGR